MAEKRDFNHYQYSRKDPATGRVDYVSLESMSEAELRLALAETLDIVDILETSIDRFKHEVFKKAETALSLWNDGKEFRGVE